MTTFNYSTNLIAADDLDLPRDLGDGLVLRQATAADAEKVAQFNLAMHSDDPDDPEMALYYWVLDLMSGKHPTTGPGDFTIVVDTNDDERIVSSLTTISQTWTFDGIPFDVGRPELVATLPEYRRRGLVRLQMEIVHAISAGRGELVTAITGIPWYYRQFGYEMCINLGGTRQLFWARPGNSDKVDEEPYQLREATADDIPLLVELRLAHLGNSPITRVRDERLWRYEMLIAHPRAVGSVRPRIIETRDGRAVGYAQWYDHGTAFILREFAVVAGHSWRAVGRFVMRHLEQQASELNEGRVANKQLSYINFILGDNHRLYEALDPDLEAQKRPYAWYIRVPDIPAFLRHIAPALERRLAASVMAGYTGKLRINLFQSRVVLVWEDGRLVEVADGYDYDRLDEGDGLFPELTFLQLLFGYRSIDDLSKAYADCYAANRDALLLFRSLFPRQSSLVEPLH